MLMSALVTIMFQYNSMLFKLVIGIGSYADVDVNYCMYRKKLLLSMQMAFYLFHFN